MLQHTGRVSSLAGIGLTTVLSILLLGCSTTPKVNWDSRIGTYTYEDALAELGPPSKVSNLEGGVKSAEWIKSRGPESGVDTMPAVYTRADIVQPDETYGYEAPNKVLRLMFTPDDKLISWQRNY